MCRKPIFQHPDLGPSLQNGTVPGLWCIWYRPVGDGTSPTIPWKFWIWRTLKTYPEVPLRMPQRDRSHIIWEMTRNFETGRGGLGSIGI